MNLADIPPDPFNPPPAEPAAARFGPARQAVEDAFAQIDRRGLEHAILAAESDLLAAALVWADGYPTGHPGDDEPAERRAKDGALRHCADTLNALLDEHARRLEDQP